MPKLRPPKADIRAPLSKEVEDAWKEIDPKAPDGRDSEHN